MVFRDLEGNEVDPTDFLTKDGKIKKKKKRDPHKQARKLLEDEEAGVIRAPGLKPSESKENLHNKKPGIPMDAADRAEERRKGE